MIILKLSPPPRTITPLVGLCMTSDLLHTHVYMCIHVYTHLAIFTVCSEFQTLNAVFFDRTHRSDFNNNLMFG